MSTNTRNIVTIQCLDRACARMCVKTQLSENGLLPFSTLQEPKVRVYVWAEGCLVGVVWPARLGRDCSEASFPGPSNSMQLFKKDKLCINTVVHEGTCVRFRVRRSSNVGAGYIEVTPTSAILPAVSCPAREGGVWGRD